VQCCVVVVDQLVVTECVECGVTRSSDLLCSVMITLLKAVV